MIRVAVGVVVNNNQVCITQRAEHVHQGGLWEFPGGKCEEGESVEDALKRELFEELGIEVTQCHPLTEITWHYPNKSVLLCVYKVTAYTGQPVGREGQPLRWVMQNELARYAFPEANTAIVDLLSQS